jgi:hypothetical protein
MHTGMFNDRFITKYRGRRNWEQVWKSVIVPNIDNLVMFTFVRNPWDRILSAFVNCQTRARHPKNKIAPIWRFQEYVKEVLGVRGPSANIHFTPQYPTVAFRGEPIPGMFVGRFERLHKDWAKLAPRLGVAPVLPRRNQSKHDHYTTYYDDESREIVRRLYQQEIRFLGYTFGDSPPCAKDTESAGAAICRC